MSKYGDNYLSHATKNYVEERLKTHTKVRAIQSVDHYCYAVKRDADEIKIVLTGKKYIFGITDYQETVAKYPDARCIVITSPYGSYTADAKESAKDKQIGLFTVGEFMGALHWSEKFWNYIKK